MKKEPKEKKAAKGPSTPQGIADHELVDAKRALAVLGFKSAALEQDWDLMSSELAAVKMAHGALEQVHQDSLLIMGAIGDLFGIGPLNMALPRALRMRLTANSGSSAACDMTAYGETFAIHQGEPQASIQQKIDDARKKAIKVWLNQQITLFLSKGRS